MPSCMSLPTKSPESPPFMTARNSSIGRPPMGWAPAVFGRFLKPGGRGGRPKLELAFPTMPLVRENARSASSNFCDDES